MFHFSAASRRHLSTCDERLQPVSNKEFKKVIEHYDCTIICGHRGKAAQMLAFENGQSELQRPDSNHNELPSKAVDERMVNLALREKRSEERLDAVEKAVLKNSTISSLIQWMAATTTAGIIAFAIKQFL